MTDINLPHETLILIATGEEAKLFRSRDGGLYPDGHWTPKNLADEGPSGKSTAEQTDQESMEATFSKQIAERLYYKAVDGEFDNLVLVADPDSLGEIRPLLHHEVEKRLIDDVDKTLINAPTNDIEKILKKEFA